MAHCVATTSIMDTLYMAQDAFKKKAMQALGRRAVHRFLDRQESRTSLHWEAGITLTTRQPIRAPACSNRQHDLRTARDGSESWKGPWRRTSAVLDEKASSRMAHSMASDSIKDTLHMA